MQVHIGLDVHKRVCQATMLQGEQVHHERFPNTPEHLRDFFSRFKRARVAMEATYCWRPAYELIESLGHEVHLAHPKRTRLIADARIKTDMHDSEALARLLLLDCLPEAWVPSKRIRELRELLRLRAYLVRESTRMKNRIHSELVKAGVNFQRNPFTIGGRKQLRELGIKGIDYCLEVLETIERKLRELGRELRNMAQENEEAQILMSVPGIGHYSALLILAEIGDIERFPDHEHLCSYAGLVPSVDQSGAHTRRGPITKEGSRHLRWILVECTWMHLMHAKDSKLRRFYYRLMRRKGKPVALVATARKLLVAVYWMLKRKEPFRG
jgi:transposase